jgi:hypothetical protein
MTEPARVLRILRDKFTGRSPMWPHQKAMVIAAAIMASAIIVFYLCSIC